MVTTGANHIVLTCYQLGTLDSLAFSFWLFKCCMKWGNGWPASTSHIYVGSIIREGKVLLKIRKRGDNMKENRKETKYLPIRLIEGTRSLSTCLRWNINKKTRGLYCFTWASLVVRRWARKRVMKETCDSIRPKNKIKPATCLYNSKDQNALVPFVY